MKQLQFDPREICTLNGKLYMRSADKEKNLLKVLVLAQILLCEKFDRRYLTIYYRHKMLLIVEYPNEDRATKALKTLLALVKAEQERPPTDRKMT